MNAMAQTSEEREERLGKLIARRRHQEKEVKTALKMKTGGLRHQRHGTAHRAAGSAVAQNGRSDPSKDHR